MLDRAPSEIKNQLLDREFTLVAWVPKDFRSCSSPGDGAEGGVMAGLEREGGPLRTSTQLAARGSGGFLAKELDRKEGGVFEAGFVRVTRCTDPPWADAGLPRCSRASLILHTPEASSSVGAHLGG